MPLSSPESDVVTGLVTGAEDCPDFFLALLVLRGDNSTPRPLDQAMEFPCDLFIGSNLLVHVRMMVNLLSQISRQWEWDL
jgi:hypothetical protein